MSSLTGIRQHQDTNSYLNHQVLLLNVVTIRLDYNYLTKFSTDSQDRLLRRNRLMLLADKFNNLAPAYLNSH